LDLTEVEQMVLLYHDLHGFTFEKIGQDLLPAHLFDRSGNVKHKVRRIYRKAKAKAQDFRTIDGDAL
jgi:DNA-directed RNA polymerase specialized sigma24 family protein